jgi:hypothetical protein
MTVCQADDPILITMPESRVFVLKCNTYLKRTKGEQLRPISPCGADGLYLGQLKPPTDYTDYDPAEKEEVHVPAPVFPEELVEACEYLTKEPECDT